MSTIVSSIEAAISSHQTSGDDPQLGILVHQLPQECMWKALAFLPKDDKCKILEVETGMKVFFSRADRTEESIRKKTIHIDGISYNIYPLVTCLTVHDIHNSISKEMIRNRLKNIDFPAICVDRVGSSHRIVLNVPEVLANFRPPSIPLRNLSLKLPMQFYCRACHKEGHKQYQCGRKDGACPGCCRNLNDATTSDKGEAKSGTPSTSTAAKSMVAQHTVPRIKNKGSLITKTQKKDSGRTLKIPKQITHSLKVEPETITSITSSESYGSRLLREALGYSEEDITDSEEEEEMDHSEGDMFDEEAITDSEEEEEMDHSEDDMVDEHTVPTNRNKDIQKAPQESRKRREKFPCKEIQDIIPKISGILPTKKFLLFLQTVYGKKDSISCAKSFTPHVYALIDQIKDLVEYYHNHGFISKGTHSYRDIRTLNSLCDRLRRQLERESN